MHWPGAGGIIRIPCRDATKESRASMNPIDLAVIAVYVAGCTALGAWLGSRSQGLKGYFLGESNIPAWAVMISIVATETSTATFLSVPGVAYNGNFTFLQLAFGYLLGRFIVATVLLPAYFRGQIFTAYQLLKDRFGGPTRTTASILFLVARSLGDGLRLFLAATMLKHLTGWSVETAIVAVATITVVYTFLGGMKAVIWTDVIQFSVYILGALVALLILTGKLPGGWSELLHTAGGAGKFRLLDFSFDLTRPYTFWAGLIGGMVLNTATHGADQMMVQRYLSARSQRQAAAALVASGFLILAQFAFFLLIGVSLWVFYREFPPSSGAGRPAPGSPGPTRPSATSSSITCRPACSGWWSRRSSRRRWGRWPARSTRRPRRSSTTCTGRSPAGMTNGT